MQALVSYLREFARRLGGGWNRFWFTPSDPAVVSLLRIGCAAAAWIYVASHTRDLVDWFGPHGMLPVETVRQLTAGENPAATDYHWSYLNSLVTPGELWFVHLLGLAVITAFAAGLAARVTSVLTLVVVLSYVHRAPMLGGLWEPVLTMMLLYLCLAPCGARWSVDRWWRGRRSSSGVVAVAPSLSATVSVRLMQLHLAGFYLMMGLTKLAGSTWWAGEAMWWLIAHSESRLVDLTGLHASLLLINFWTHAVVLFELSFGVLIWVRLARPLLLVIAVVMWSSLSLVTGQLGFCGMMILANLAFLEPAWIGSWAGLREEAAALGSPATNERD